MNAEGVRLTFQEHLSLIKSVVFPGASILTVLRVAID
jgi:hypothetical protein